MKNKGRYNPIPLVVIIIGLILTIISLKDGISIGDSSNREQDVDKQHEILPSDALISELGCNTCHSGLPGENVLRTRAPDLSHAGLRYEPAYLFHYLQNPEKVRHNIGLSRMPDFGFSPEESLALTLFLSSQEQFDKSLPDFPDIKGSNALWGGDRKIREGEKVFSELACTACHVANNEGNLVASDLSSSGFKLQPEWMKKYLVAPGVFRGKETIMPSAFYKITSDSSRFEEAIPEAAKKMDALVEFLASLTNDENMAVEASYEKFAKANHQITMEMGKNIFLSQNCAACHRTTAEGTWREKTAPDLSLESSMVRQGWLQTFLKDPHPIRPFGFFPGSGSRMPDYSLNDQEVDLIASYLNDQVNVTAQSQPTEFIELTTFSLAKTEALIKDKFSCLGCHRLGEEGGRIGPDLSNINSRLRPGYIEKLIRDPQGTLPGSVMPKPQIPPKYLDLVISYLIQHNEPSKETKYLSLTVNNIILTRANEEGPEALYLTYCASCHGTSGNAEGFNARYLAALPTRHADAAHMSQRPDDTLFDGIYAGAYILNKSHLMPAFGHTLDSEQILDLVEYMRTLCNCSGPEWSTDNSGSTKQ